MPVSSPSVSVSVTILIAASTVSVRRRVPSSVRHLVDYQDKQNIIQNLKIMNNEGLWQKMAIKVHEKLVELQTTGLHLNVADHFIQLLLFIFFQS